MSSALLLLLLHRIVPVAILGVQMALLVVVWTLEERHH